MAEFPRWALVDGPKGIDCITLDALPAALERGAELIAKEDEELTMGAYSVVSGPRRSDDCDFRKGAVEE